MPVRALSALFGVLALLAPVLAADETDSFPDKLSILAKLEERRFEELDRELGDLLRGAEKDVRREDHVRVAFEAFQSVNPALEPLLDEWARRSAREAAPHLARAEYFLNLAHHRRGYRYADKTPPERLEAMKATLPYVTEAVDRALALAPKCTEAYALRINAAMFLGDDARTAELAKRAILEVPDTDRARRAYLQALLPRWGGSYEKMTKFAELAQTFVARNPRLAILPGFVAWDQAAVVLEDENYGAALSLITAALGHGEHWEFYARLGNVYSGRREHDKAMAAFDRSLALFPQEPTVLRDRAWALVALDRLEDAERDLSLVARLDPGVETERTRRWLGQRLTSRAFARKTAGRFGEAIALLDRALAADATNAEAQYWRGQVKTTTGDLGGAEIDLRKAIERDPRHLEAHRSLDWVLQQRNRWPEIVALWTSFLALEPENANAFLERAGAYHHKGDHAAALEDLAAACRLGHGHACAIHAQETGGAAPAPKAAR